MIPTIQTTPLDTTGTERLRSVDNGAGIDPNLRAAFLGVDEAQSNLDRLFAGNALCVTTGQQPGLFTGPLLTVYKAMSAVALARRCESLLDRPVIPVFWVAGDDHDFAESNHVFLLSKSNDVERVRLRERDADAAATPMYREALGNDVTAALDQLTELLPETEFRTHCLDWLSAHYRPDADMATAFAGAMAQLLGRFGLVVFQPTHPAAKQAISPWLMTALERAQALNAAVIETAAELTAAGRPVPVATRPGNTLVMIEGSLGRDRLLIDGSGFLTRRSGEPWTFDALRHLSQDDPQRLSPNVLLRPVVEAGILPTLTYIGGPGERAYFPQAASVYDTLDVNPQGAVTRWSGRVIEKRVAKVLEKYGIVPEDLLAQEGQLEARLVRGAMPDAATRALTTMRSVLEDEYPKLLDAAAAVDPTLRKPVQSARSGALSGLADVEKRLVSNLKQRDDVMVRQVANARQALFPLHKPQERVFNVMHYLVRYGNEFLDGVATSCDAWADSLNLAAEDGN